jgi:hypothetical protein
MAMTSDFQKVLIQSFHDPLHPTTLCTMSGGSFKFISGTEIGIVTISSPNDPIHGTSLVGRMSLTDLMPVTVVEVPGHVGEFAWSPDGSSVAYLVNLAVPGNANQVWLKTGNARPRALTPPITFGGRGGSIDDQILVSFSPDGRYVLVVDTALAGAVPASPDQASVQVHSVPDGNLVFVPPSALTSSGKLDPFVTMAAWSRQTDRLYYRDPAGVHTWDPPAAEGILVAGLRWFFPSMSPDGRFVAYAVNMRDQPHVEVFDLGSNKVQVIPGTRGSPLFITANMLFEVEYILGQPGPGPPYGPNGRNFMFDLRTNVETPIPGNILPTDYWPR